MGLFEGEGSFIAGPPSAPRRAVACVVSTDRDVIDRAAGLLGSTVITRSRKSAPAHWKPIYEARLRGGRAARFMAAARPYMSRRRQEAIDKALAATPADARHATHVPVLD